MKETKVLHVEHKFAAISQDGKILDLGRNLKGFSKKETAQKNLDDCIRFYGGDGFNPVATDGTIPSTHIAFMDELRSAKVVKIKISYEVASGG